MSKSFDYQTARSQLITHNRSTPGGRRSVEYEERAFHTPARRESSEIAASVRSALPSVAALTTLGFILSSCTSSGPEAELVQAISKELTPLRTTNGKIEEASASQRLTHNRQLIAQTIRSVEPRANIADHRAEYLRGENRLNAALTDAWLGFSPTTPDDAFLIDEALSLAMLDLQAELRRTLGPNNHTQVPGLVEDAGCAGDIVQDQLVYRFGAALLTLEASEISDSSEPANRVADLFARQVACLGDKQLAELDVAMSRGFELVASRMRFKNLHAIVPAFARAVAPLEAIIFDARKHRGSFSASTKWFGKYRSILKTAVARSGWATGDLLVWDRRVGILVGVPSCAIAGASRCVDFESLIDSFSDPRAIGEGRCSLGYMIAGGKKDFPDTSSGATDSELNRLAGPRYVCPTAACDPQGNARSGGFSAERRGHLTSVWGEISPQDETVMTNVCRSPGGDPAGTFPDLGNCLQDEIKSMFAGQNSPFERFAECVFEGMSGPLPDLSTSPRMTGVPMGPDCALMDDGGETGEDERGGFGGEDDSEAEEDETTDDEEEEDEGDNDADTEETKGGGDTSGTIEPLGAATAMKTRAADGTYDYVYVSRTGNIYIVQTGGVILVYDDSLGEATYRAGDASAFDVADQETFALEFLTEQIAFYENDEEMRLANAVIRELAIRDTEGTLEASARGANGITVTEWPPGAPPRPGDCVDPGACRNECTGLGRQISVAEACTEALIDELAAATGRSKDDIDPNLGPVIYPRPDGFDQEGTFGACFDAGLQRGSPLCGLVLCGDGMSAEAESQMCGCGTAAPGQISVDSICASVRCADGAQPMGSSCDCSDAEPVEGTLPGGGPIPDPAIWETSVSGPVCMSRAIVADQRGAFTTYNYGADLLSISGNNGVSAWTSRGRQGVQ